MKERLVIIGSGSILLLKSEEPERWFDNNDNRREEEAHINTLDSVHPEVYYDRLLCFFTL